MIQEILTWITVTGAILYTLYAFWKTFFASSESGCGGGCSSCEAKDLLIKDIDRNKKTSKFDQFRPVK
jgi:hypothetical protein